MLKNTKTHVLNVFRLQWYIVLIPRRSYLKTKLDANSRPNISYAYIHEGKYRKASYNLDQHSRCSFPTNRRGVCHRNPRIICGSEINVLK